MDQHPQLSILLPLQNRRDAVEQTLTSLFELGTVEFELFIIDDASTDGTGQAVYSLLDYYEHEHTFFFEHAKPVGRGNCLNRLLREVNTNVVWAINSLQSVDEKALSEAVATITHSNSLCLAQQFSVPENDGAWLELFAEESFPADGQFLWNIENITSTEHFFNPYLKHFHCFEWLVRLNKMDVTPTLQKFYQPLAEDKDITPSEYDRREMIISMMRRPNLSTDIYEELAGRLQEKSRVSPRKPDAEYEHELLENAVRLTKEGQLSAALEHVENILESEPGNNKAKRLKVKILERKRRFVEASELKHEINIEEGDSNKVHVEIHPDQVKTSIIIPTALHGKPMLEHCLMSIAEHADPMINEVIIIDNASLDDTFDYIQELQEKNFFNCKIITNEQNKGFAASVNQGMEAASGDYYCLMHNDVELESGAVSELEQLMDDNPDFALIGPLTDSTLNPDQLISNQTEEKEGLIKTDFLDSFLMMMRADVDAAMDEKFTLAFFDDIDLSFQIRDAGYKVGIAPHVSVTHHYGNTTFALDLDTDSKLYWKNISVFNEKWEVGTFSEEQLEEKDAVEQLLLLDQWVNPLYPEEPIKEKFEELFTSELKTKILKEEHDQETLRGLTHIFMVMDERETMRRLEERLTKPDLPITFIYELVRFYFDRNVYSRCLHYLDRLTMQQQSMQSELYRLAILIDEKKVEKAIPKLTEMLEKAPSNPFLYKLAGDIYTFQNDNDEAESFYRLAEQINPFDYGSKEKNKIETEQKT